MSASKEIDSMVTETVVDWIHDRVKKGAPPRLNLRFVFGDARLAQDVRAVLEAENGTGPTHFIVRRSSDADAVRLRHGRPDAASAATSVVYVLFWQPGTSEHERNAQSLADLRAVEISEVLARSETFVLAAEKKILTQCEEAAATWKEQHRERASEHLRAAWNGLRKCVRQFKGGRQASIPFVSKLDDYCRFLVAAHVPDTSWNAAPLNERATLLVETWGRALPELRLFSMPALASILGVRTRPDAPEKIESVKRTREDLWADVLAQVLAENIEYAVDFSALGDALAGKRTLQEQLDVLAERVALCQDQANRKEARAALERFCHDGDEAALRKVEWLFLESASDRRSASLGLKGLLLARGRRAPAPDPIERAAAETIALFEAAVGGQSPDAEVLRGFVAQSRTAAAADPRAASSIADTLRALAEGGSLEVTSTEVAQSLGRATSSSSLKAESLLRVANLWSALVKKEPERAVEAPNLLLALARLVAHRLSESPVDNDGRRRLVAAGGTAGHTLVLSLPGGETPCKIDVPVGDWTEATLDRISEWMRNDVRTAVFATDEEAGEEDEDAEPRQEIDIEVGLRAGNGATKAFGLLRLHWSPRARRVWSAYRSDVPSSWSRDLEAESVPTGYRLIRALEQRERTSSRGEAPDSEAVTKAWEAYAKYVGGEAGLDVAAMLAPTHSKARGWVEAWATAVQSVTAAAGTGEAAARRQALEDQLRQAIKEKRYAELDALQWELDSLPEAKASSTQEVLKEARALLRIASVAFLKGGRGLTLALTPHHALVVRLRAVSDHVLADVLRAMWENGWADSAVDDLLAVLSSWGTPEPMHAYGFWDNDPLAFDGWLEGAVAIFTPLGTGRDLDASSLGAREVGRIVTRYADLFPAAADRLALRARGDTDGRWALQILADHLNRPTFRADLDVVTSLGSREQTAIEQAVYAGRVASEPFELGPEGALPRVRVRRRRDSDVTKDPTHLALLVGDQIEAFQPTWDRSPLGERADAAPLWSSSILFAEAVPTLRGYSFSVGDPDDALSRSVSKVVALACGATGTVFRERYAFDPTRCEAPLREQQGNAHWLVLASRQPLYRAVQQVGDRIATLLDFYTLTERGRPVHVCVSLNSVHAADDLKRIDAALAELLDGDAKALSGRALMNAAVRLAPGLAMQCAGATGAARLGGLVGLLLTGSALAEAHPDALVLSLDQHQALLRGRGRLGDLLLVRDVDGEIRIGVGESKFTTGSVDATSAVVDDAKRQIESSVERLQHLGEFHPLSLAIRNALIRAITHQAHMAFDDEARIARAEKIIERLRSAATSIRIESAPKNAIHVWSTATATTGSTSAVEGGPAVTIHARTATLERLAAMA